MTFTMDKKQQLQFVIASFKFEYNGGWLKKIYVRGKMRQIVMSATCITFCLHVA